MVTLVVYDVADNRERQKVERVCRDKGLSRVQYSVFRGSVGREARQALVRSLTALARKNPAETWDVQIYFISAEDFPAHVRLKAGGPVADLEKIERLTIV